MHRHRCPSVYPSTTQLDQRSKCTNAQMHKCQTAQHKTSCVRIVCVELLRSQRHAFACFCLSSQTTKTKTASTNARMCNFVGPSLTTLTHVLLCSPLLLCVISPLCMANAHTRTHTHKPHLSVGLFVCRSVGLSACLHFHLRLHSTSHSLTHTTFFCINQLNCSGEGERLCGVRRERPNGLEAL